MRNLIGTYYAPDSQRLADYLIATRHPFHYDGEELEFDATSDYMCRMFDTDKYLATLTFEFDFHGERVPLGSNGIIKLNQNK